jgi:hypothetical protein
VRDGEFQRSAEFGILAEDIAIDRLGYLLHLHRPLVHVLADSGFDSPGTKAALLRGTAVGLLRIGRHT